KKGVDRTVTLVLVFGTIVLEGLTSEVKDSFKYKQWPDKVDKHSVLGYFARNRRHNMFVRFMRFFQCKDILDQNWSMEPCYSSMDITKLVHQHVRDGWKDYIKDAESYREFNDIRGQWTLVRESCDQSLGWSLEKPFDESVLLWHIATDFCFQQMDIPPDHECATRSREISNYMMHLLFMNPEMLMPGSRRNLFKTVYRELRDILKGEGTSNQEKGIAQKTIDKLKHNADLKINLIYDAWVLAKGLMDIGDDSKMWKVIQGVWLEMLCFSAGRCRGYLHAKSLGSGVEYLSFVWLLLAYVGMETFSERIQRTMSIKLLKQRIENLPNGESGNNNFSVSPDEGAAPFDEIVVLP
uniref:DUF4220 domain-containing protein n=1 Tax=Aegilops tauschii subsp. strangulata TaxID=200361 RepID=A0A453DMG1_AEGTS